MGGQSFICIHLCITIEGVKNVYSLHSQGYQSFEMEFGKCLRLDIVTETIL